MGFPFQYVGRDASASTATGLHHVHDREQAELVAAAIGRGALPTSSRPHPVRPLGRARQARSEPIMAVVPITVPGVGESIAEGILARWLKPDGAAVKSGDPLFELETDKASNVVPASTSGVLKIGVAEGTTVEIGATVGTIDPAGSPAAAAAAAAPAAPRNRRRGPRPRRNGGARAAPPPPPLSPAVRRIVAEEHVDPSKVEGTGRGGRVTKGDVARPPRHRRAAPAPSPAPPRSGPPPPAPARSRRRAARDPQADERHPPEDRQRLVEAQHTAAILTTFNEADMSRVMDLRARYKDAFKAKHGVGPRLHVVLRQGGDRGAQGVPRGQRPGRRPGHRLQQLLTTSASPSAPSAG